MLALRTIKNKIHASGLNWERETKAYTLRHLIPLRFSNQHCYSIPTTNRRDRHPIIDYIGGDLSAGSPTDTLLRLSPPHESLVRQRQEAQPH
jgi:hypothetical protein